MPTAHSTFVFADIAGFTALTEAHGDDEAAELAELFATRVGAAVPGADAELVKTIGDAVLVRAPGAAAAVELGVSIACELMADHGFPAVRVGMHRGSAVRRGDDWFGGAVNCAARVTALASGGEVVLSDAVRLAAGELPGIALEDLGEQRLRGFAAPVRVWRARRAGVEQPGWPIDPVCRMAVEPGREAGRLRHGGVEHLFCSLGCAARFAAAPDAFADR